LDTDSAVDIFILTIIGISCLLIGYVMIRFDRQTSIQEARKCRKRPAFTGISATIMGTGMIIVGIIAILNGFFPQNEVVRMNLWCSNGIIFYVVIFLVSVIIQSIRSRLTPSDDKSKF
jgi:hypothetical protein